MTSSHTCPQYSQLNADTAIARVQLAHRFQVIARTVRQAPYHGSKQAISGLFYAAAVRAGPGRASELRGG